MTRQYHKSANWKCSAVRSFSDEEILFLNQLAQNHQSGSQIAKQMNEKFGTKRTRSSVGAFCHRNKIKLTGQETKAQTRARKHKAFGGAQVFDRKKQVEQKSPKRRVHLLPNMAVVVRLAEGGIPSSLRCKYITEVDGKVIYCGKPVFNGKGSWCEKCNRLVHAPPSLTKKEQRNAEYTTKLLCV